MVDFKDELDDFWDVSKLVPKTQKRISGFSSNVKTEEVVIEKREDTEKAYLPTSERKINFSAYETSREDKKASKEPYSYIPKNNKLLQRVTIKPSLDRFDFYDTFRKAALIYFDYKCPRSDFVSFYSYKPQYSQMTQEQKKYYFFWRDEVRNGRYIKTDYSYIYLYAYEILNLPEKIGKHEGLELLVEIWRAYRKELPRIDQNFALWLQDYCLIYELDCPFDKIKDFLFDVINASAFKEFYLSDVDKSSNGASAMIAYLSDYDWRRGKYAGGENSEMYRMHVEGAMQAIFAFLLAEDAVKKSDISKITRTAFAGSLCTHSVKCILEIEYSSIADSPELRSSVTSALKYTENKLRACLGVKSRLAIKGLPDSLRYVIDKYFESEFARLKKERERANAPEYERLYDAPEESNATFADAIEIERASWKMTARLVEGTEDFESADIAEEEPSRECAEITECAQNNEQEPREASETYGLSELEVAFLRSVFDNNNNEASHIAKDSGALAENVAEKINEAFADNFGDVILEEDGMGGFKVIDDYNEEISEWLCKIQK